MSIYEHVSMCTGTMVHTDDKMRQDGHGGAYACMIWGAWWPGNFPAHHVRTRFAKKSAQREMITQNMFQAPHISCMHPNKSKQEPTIPKNSPKL